MKNAILPEMKTLETKIDDIVVGLHTLTEKVGGLDKRVNRLDKKFDGLDKKVDGLAKRVDGVDKKLGNLAKRVDGQGEHMDSLGRRLDKLTSTVHKGFERMDFRFDQVDAEIEDLAGMTGREFVTIRKDWGLTSTVQHV